MFGKRAKIFAIFSTIFTIFLVLFSYSIDFIFLLDFMQSSERLHKTMIELLSTDIGKNIVAPIIPLYFSAQTYCAKLLARTLSYFYDDGYPDFEGKYLWRRNDLDYCKGEHELFWGQNKGMLEMLEKFMARARSRNLPQLQAYKLPNLQALQPPSPTRPLKSAQGPSSPLKPQSPKPPQAL